MIDRDEHKSFDQALQSAASLSNVDVIVSYPCFEYWLLLHFIYSRKPYRRAGDKSPAECLIDDLKKQPGMADYAKGVVASLFSILTLEQLATARRRSERALQEGKEVGDLNPSTRLHELITYIESLGEPAPIDPETPGR